jgi:hypothetical protein
MASARRVIAAPPGPRPALQRGSGHPEHGAAGLVLGDHHTPPLAELEQPGGAVVTHPGEHHADPGGAGMDRDRAEEDVGGGPVERRRLGVERHPARPAEGEVDAGGGDVHEPGAQRHAVGHHLHRERRAAAEQLEEAAEEAVVDVLDHQHRRAQVADLAQHPGHRGRSAGRRGDADHGQLGVRAGEQPSPGVPDHLHAPEQAHASAQAARVSVGPAAVAGDALQRPRSDGLAGKAAVPGPGDVEDEDGDGRVRHHLVDDQETGVDRPRRGGEVEGEQVRAQRAGGAGRQRGRGLRHHRDVALRLQRVQQGAARAAVVARHHHGDAPPAHLRPPSRRSTASSSVAWSKALLTM